MKLILRLLINSVAVYLAAHYIPGITLSAFGTAVVMALVLGLVNLLIRPLLALLTLPINLITFGLFGLVLNALMFWLASYFVNDMTVLGFIPALLGSLFVAVIAWIGEKILGIT